MAGAGAGAKKREKLEVEPKISNFGSATLINIFFINVICKLITNI